MAIHAGDLIHAADRQIDVIGLTATNDTSASTSYITGTSHGVAFTAPTSGAVLIRFGGLLGSNHNVSTLCSYLTLQVRAGATVGSGALVLTAADGNACRYYKPNTAAGYHYSHVEVPYLLTGLTPGNDHNVQTLFRAVVGSAGVAQRWVTVSSANA
ncbi:hypothetical protein GCM10010124_26250 [Pilimelia terevasa]|uniref:Uncharacterized protein n=1 Tax=Pilimelia terevasa TaxID=53372 RepID=A0A8J3BV39_9ACTN|nr:hypothetical protein [Pilimelia terevasa]GGK32199.1 hypothetical protein GCM10010124_26250 [Pilimelia terevasa]